MPVSINGIDQMPPEENIILLKMRRESKASFWISVSGLIIAAVALTVAIVR